MQGVIPTTVLKNIGFPSRIGVAGACVVCLICEQRIQPKMVDVGVKERPVQQLQRRQKQKMLAPEEPGQGGLLPLPSGLV